MYRNLVGTVLGVNDIVVSSVSTYREFAVEHLKEKYSKREDIRRFSIWLPNKVFWSKVGLRSSSFSKLVLSARFII